MKYRRKHPRAFLVAIFEDFVAEALLLPSMLQKIDPVNFFVLGELLEERKRTT